MLSDLHTGVIFLDIDGVLNSPSHYGTAFDPATDFDRKCVIAFNRIITYTGAAVVLSSSWRHQIFNGDYTLKGFNRMLRTHGVCCELIGTTARDEYPLERGEQVSRWVDRHKPSIFMAIDDDAAGFESLSRHFLKTDGSVGLTDKDAERAIEMYCSQLKVKGEPHEH